MNRLYETLLAVALLCVWSTHGKEMADIQALGAQPTYCTYDYAYKMYGAHCAGRHLRKIPKLRSGIEILDFSDNYRELHADTLSSYTSIKFLYLAHNNIFHIDKDALTSFTYLQTLDLANNVILELSSSIFQLPSLRKLYLRGNPIFYKPNNSLVLVKPIKAPLELLDLSDCKIKELPNFGYLPQLKFYDISYNPLTSLRTDHFAVMCNLVKVDLTESISNIKLCGLRSTVLWLQEKRVSIKLDDYSWLNTTEFENCPVPDDGANHNATFQKCKAEYFQVQSIMPSCPKWLTICGGLAAFFVGYILLLWMLHLCNVALAKKEKAKKAKKIKQATPTDLDKNTNTLLLNDGDIA